MRTYVELIGLERELIFTSASITMAPWLPRNISKSTSRDLFEYPNPQKTNNQLWTHNSVSNPPALAVVSPIPNINAATTMVTQELSHISIPCDWLEKNY